MNFCFYTKLFFMLLQYRAYDICKECVHLLFGTSSIACRIHCLLKFVQTQIKGRISRDQFQKIIIKPFFLDIFPASMESSRIRS